MLKEESKIYKEIYLVKGKLQKNTLNKIQYLAREGIWSKIIFGVDFGINGYINDNYLSKQLDNFSNLDNIRIAKQLCFEAINIGVISQDSTSHNTIPVTEFAKKNFQILESIIKDHQEYFVYNTIKSLFSKNISTINGD
jgi:hypothetical protein